MINWKNQKKLYHNKKVGGGNYEELKQKYYNLVQRVNYNLYKLYLKNYYFKM